MFWYFDFHKSSFNGLSCACSSVGCEVLRYWTGAVQDGPKNCRGPGAKSICLSSLFVPLCVMFSGVLAPSKWQMGKWQRFTCLTHRISWTASTGLEVRTLMYVIVVIQNLRMRKDLNITLEGSLLAVSMPILLLLVSTFFGGSTFWDLQYLRTFRTAPNSTSSQNWKSSFQHFDNFWSTFAQIDFSRVWKRDQMVNFCSNKYKELFERAPFAARGCTDS